MEVSLQWLPQNSHKDPKHLGALAPNLSPELASGRIWVFRDNLFANNNPLLAPKLSNSGSLSFCEFASISITKVLNLGANHRICQN